MTIAVSAEGKKRKKCTPLFVSTRVLIRLGRQLESKLVEAFCIAKAGDKCASTLSVTLTYDIAYPEGSMCINVLLAWLTIAVSAEGKKEKNAPHLFC